MELTELCKSAKEVSRQIGNLDTNTKNEVLVQRQRQLWHIPKRLSARMRRISPAAERIICPRDCWTV